MQLPTIIKSPIFWISTCIIIGIIIYFIVSKTTHTYRETCKPNEEIINGKCVPKCLHSRCKNGECYDPITQYCDTNGVICNTISHCPSSNTCCPNGQQCEKLTNTCKACDINCNGTCCNPDEKCTENKTICCTKEHMYTDKNGDLKCCKSKLCNGIICCDEGIGEVCIDGTCKIGCPNLAQLNSGLYTKCDGKDNVFTGTPVDCDNNTSVCLHNCTDTNKPFECIPKSDCWKNTTYTPNLLLDNWDKTYDYTLTSGLYKGSNTKVAVCQDVKNNLWISNTSSADLNRSVSADADPNYINQPSCNVDTCISKISESSSGVINYDELKDKGMNNTNITNNICNSELSCTNSLLEDKEMQNLCTLFDKDINTQGRCCKKNDNTAGYTGQICAQSGICINDISGYKCYGLDDKSICNNNGTLQKDRTCTCNFGYMDRNNRSTCLSTIDVNQFTQQDVVNLLNKIDYIITNYKSDFISFFTNNAVDSNYMLVYCLPGGKYANFLANSYGGQQCRVGVTPIVEFHAAIYGENKGDLIMSDLSTDGIGFWYDNGRDTGTCTIYVSTDRYGNIDNASNFTYGNPNSKLFENVINNNRIRLGVLLIGPTTHTCP